jgi:ABC-type sugar transport system substrate-binding protein
MVAEKWVQVFIDVIKAKGCVTRHFVVEYVMANYGVPREKALNIVDDTLAALVKHNVIVRKGRGVYCWSGPP